VVFTPPDLARRLVAPLLEEVGPGTPILDPACGDGALLIAALRVLGGGPEAAERLLGIEVDPRLAGRARARLAEACGVEKRALSPRILTRDALAREIPWPSEAAIVANPPWVSFSGRQSGSAKVPSPSRPSRGGWPSLHGAFLERIARYCAHEGTPARVLLPASLLELDGYAPLRAAVSEHVHLAEPPEELGEDAFPGVIEPAAILTLAPGPSPTSESWSTASPPKNDFLRSLERLPRLPPRTFADPGVHTGNSAAQLIAHEARPGWAPLRRGADLAPYALGPASLWLRLDLEATPERRFRFGALERYQGFPVLLRQTANRPIAALHSEPTYFRNSLLAAREVPGLHPAFLVALLNSKVAGQWHRSLFPDARQRTFPQVKVGHLQTQPTPIECRDQDPELHDSIVERVTRLRPDSPGFEAQLRWIDRRLRRAFEEAVRPTAR